jgi:CheY-like chemotaxis protein
VAVYSEPGRGATFKVYLPRTDATGAPPPAVRAPESPRRGSETILLVEDDEALRAVIHEQLEAGGYAVVDGPTPEASLAAAESHAGPIHVMVTDLVMPRLSGREAATRVRAARPGIRVLYMSGCATAAAGFRVPSRAHTGSSRSPSPSTRSSARCARSWTPRNEGGPPGPRPVVGVRVSAARRPSSGPGARLERSRRSRWCRPS